MKCKICKTKFEVKYPFQQVCSNLECMNIFAIKQINNKRIKERKDWKRVKKEMRENIKTLSDWKKELQTEINHIIRLIDNGQPCIATGKITGKRNAGHYYSVGGNPTLRFHLHNIHIQSEYSNTYKSGDNINYMNGMISVYGKDYFDYVSSLKSHPEINLTVNDLKEKIKIARQIVKELMSDYLQNYIAIDRIELRSELNNRLGIYQM
jgi:hypothetical protein